LSAANAATIAEIVRRLDGIPLALELATARLRMLSVDQIAERLNDRFRLLTGGRRTAMARQQTLQAMIDWSWNLLDEKEQLLLQRLSVFSGGWSLEAAQAVAADEKLDEYAVFDLLEQLVNKSLVTVSYPAPRLLHSPLLIWGASGRSAASRQTIPSLFGALHPHVWRETLHCILR
jgi:predicted ATPase